MRTRAIRPSVGLEKLQLHPGIKLANKQSGTYQPQLATTSSTQQVTTESLLVLSIHVQRQILDLSALAPRLEQATDLALAPRLEQATDGKALRKAKTP